MKFVFEQRVRVVSGFFKGSSGDVKDWRTVGFWKKRIQYRVSEHRIGLHGSIYFSEWIEEAHLAPYPEVAKTAAFDMESNK
jgi:hypothetical protein